MWTTYKSIYLIVIFLMTVIPMLGGYYYDWSWEYIRISYSACLAFVTLLAFIYYHKHLTVYFFTLLLSWAAFTIEDSYIWEDIRIPMTFWVIYSGCWLFYFEIGRSRLGQKIRMWHPIGHLTYYLTFMMISMYLCVFTVIKLYDAEKIFQELPEQHSLFLRLMAFIIPTLTISFLKIIDMIGSKHVLYFLLGTYKRPVEKIKIVLFLDMIGSTKIAEQLSPQKSMELISNFIFDASYIFRIHSGDILNYTGDGLVVTWPIGKAENALESIKALEDRILKYKPVYQKKYNHTPKFRVGLHAGKIVISQIGEERLFLGVYGDAVNTTARLEQLNKKLGTRILLSGYVKRLLGKKYEKRLIPLGTQPMNGKQKDMEVFTLSKEI